ncbi:MAG: hypothetical protein JWR21_3282 [Herminiimonas sp.]|nr:hypothetical protein [Herminiimonas sp.]
MVDFSATVVYGKQVRIASLLLRSAAVLHRAAPGPFCLSCVGSLPSYNGSSTSIEDKFRPMAQMLIDRFPGFSKPLLCRRCRLSFLPGHPERLKLCSCATQASLNLKRSAYVRHRAAAHRPSRPDGTSMLVDGSSKTRQSEDAALRNRQRLFYKRFRSRPRLLLKRMRFSRLNLLHSYPLGWGVPYRAAFFNGASYRIRSALIRRIPDQAQISIDTPASLFEAQAVDARGFTRSGAVISPQPPC